MPQIEIRIEEDTAPDAWDYGGHRVVVETDRTWKVVFRGDIAECEDFARTHQKVDRAFWPLTV